MTTERSCDRDAKPLVLICAWCVGAEARTAAAIAQGYDVTHGICESCLKAWEDSDVAR